MNELKWEGDSMFDHGIVSSGEVKPLKTDIKVGMVFNIPVLVLNMQNVEILADSREISENQWLAIRKRGFGGSDVAKIFSPDKYGSEMTVALEKQNPVVGEQESNFYLERGKRLENPIIVWFQDEFQKATGKWINLYKSPFVYHSLINDYQIMNIDGLCWVDEFELPDGTSVSGLGLIEVKTASMMVRDKWVSHDSEIDDILGDVPDKYWYQCQYYMDGLGLDWTILPFWIDGEMSFRVIRKNVEFCASMHEKLKPLKETIDAGGIPEPVGVEAEKKSLIKAFPEGEGEIEDETVLDQILEYGSILERESEIKNNPVFEEQKKVKAEKERIETIIKAKMTKNKYLKCGEFIATWNRFPKKSFTVKESVGEKFTIKRSGV